MVYVSIPARRKPLTVVIPTCRRPYFLRDALQSVADQTSLDRVETVIVSENSDSDDSRKVCEEFHSLPVQYIQQVQPLPALEHFAAFSKLVDTNLVAILHDDDWWFPTHLADSLEALEQTDVVACFSNILETYSPRHPVRTSHKALRVWAATGCDFSRKIIRLSEDENFLVHLLSTSFHYSTYVGCAENCIRATEQLVQLGNEYDNDRNFPILLGECGNIAYITSFGAAIRIHPGQDCAREMFVNGSSRYAENTRYLATKYPAAVDKARCLYQRRILPDLSNNELLQLEQSISFEQKEALRDSCGFGMQTLIPEMQNVKRNLLLRLVNKLMTHVKKLKH
jgi:glycosyltransferase involved in cell wall biosynthesis